MSIMSFLARSATGIFVLISSVVAWETRYYTVNPLPDLVPQNEEEPQFKAPVMFLSREGASLCPKYQERIVNQDLESIRDFSPYLIKALLASEDQRFYWHFGIDPIGIGRAALVNLLARDIQQGGSTITLQLAETLYWDELSPLSWKNQDQQVTWSNKFREILAALKLETRLSKDEILVAYMNRVYLGGGLYGFEAAAQQDFGKSAAFLTLEEAATLVSRVPAPNSREDKEKDTENRNGLIQDMSRLGLISAEEAAQAQKTPLNTVSTAQNYYNSAWHYCEYLVNTEMPDILSSTVYQKGGFIVETTLDVDVQDRTEELVRNFLVNDGINLGTQQGAVVTLDTGTGEIVGMTGGLDDRDNESDIDRATQPNRQPGSTFKLFTYAAALERGVSPATLLPCGPLEWTSTLNGIAYRYKGCEQFQGSQISLEQALIYSENAPSVYLAQNYLGRNGLEEVIQTAKRFGITSNLSATPGLVIGGTEEGGVSLLEMTGSYAAVANQGVWNKPHGIRRIRQMDAPKCDTSNIETCPILYDALDPQQGNLSRRVLGVDKAQVMDNMLSRVISEQGGTGSSAYLGREERGKTGTTDDYTDVWFIGYVPSVSTTTGVWFGNDDGSVTRAKSSDAAKFWATYMNDIMD